MKLDNLKTFEQFVASGKYNLKDSVNEAFRYKDQERALQLILKYLTKKLGNLFQLPGFETVVKQDGTTLLGIHYIDINGDSFRFNWNEKEKSSEIHSIDFFYPEQMFGNPEVSLELQGESTARILPAVVEIHKRKDVNIDLDTFIIGESELKRYSSSLNEYRTPGALGKKTIAKINTQKETKVNNDITNDEQLLYDTPYADPDTIFDDVNSYIDMVINGIQSSVIVAGAPGVGKTFGIKQTIKKAGLVEIKPIELPEGAENMEADELKDLGYDPSAESSGDFVFIKGAVSAFGMYSNLYKYKNKLIVFDDCDSVFRDKDGVNLLKGALDSSDERIISWISAKTTGPKAILPPRFKFDGKIIFISNLNLPQIDSAVRSRSFVVDIKLKTTDIIKRIETIIQYIGNDLQRPLTMDAKMRALDFLKEKNEDPTNKMEISIRSLVNFAKIAQCGASSWKRLMEIQVQNMQGYTGIRRFRENSNRHTNRPFNNWVFKKGSI